MWKVKTALLTIAAILPSAGEPARERVATIERNHVFDGCGKVVLTQLIFWGGESGADVIAWRFDNGQLIVRDWQSGGYAIRWHDGGIFREVRATAFRESWTQYDVELAERDKLPQEDRRGLWGEKVQ